MTERSVVIRLKGEIGDFQAKMKQAQMSIGATVGTMTSASKQGAAMRQNFSTIGAAAGKVGLAAAAGFGAVVATAANFDQAMSNVQAATHESAAGMEQLRQAAIKAGADTAFSASEAAEGVENLAKAGVDTTEILGGGLQGALDLAAAGGMEVAEAAEAAAGAMAQFKLEGSEVPHIADLLAAGAGKAQGEVSDMVMALKQAGTVSAQTGLTIEETTGALAAMAEQSLLGSDAGTSFKTMLAALTPNSEKAASAMEQYNIHAYDAQGNFVGMTALAGQLRDGLGGLTDEQRAMTMETIFGSDAVRAASIIYDNGADGIQGWIDKTNDAGYASETAAIKLDNLKGDLEAFMGSLETALIGAGEGSQGMLRGVVQGATEAVNAFSNLSPAMQNTATAMLGITAIVGGGLWFGSKVIQGVAGTRAALTALGVTATGTKAKLASAAAFAGGPWGIGLAAAGVAAYALSTVNDDLTESLEATAAALSDGVTSIDDQAASLDIARKNVADYKAGLDEVTLFDPANFKNDLEGIFGKSDIEEAEEALADLEEQFHANREEVQATDRDLGHLSGAVDKNADGFVTSTDVIIDNTEALKENMETQADAVEAALAMIDAEYAYEASLRAVDDRLQERKDLQKELAEARADVGNAEGKEEREAALEEVARLEEELEGYRLTLDKTTEAGLNNWQVLREQAQAWNDLDGATQDAKGAHKAAKEELIKTAREFGATKKEAKEYARELLELPPKVLTRVTVETEQALTAIGKTKAALDALRDKKVVVTTEQNTINNAPRAIARAAGGHVTGPGTATSDSIPAYLSNGEYVVRAAAVAKYGTAVFDELNAMRFASGGFVAATRPAPMPAFANGGPVSGGSGGREVPLIHIGELRHNDMRETARWVREKSVLESGGGVNF